MRKRSSLIVAAILVAVVVVAAIRLAHRGHSEPVEVSAKALPTASVARVERDSISRSLTLAGEFQPYQVVDVHSKVSGYIRHIYVDIGDKVHTGETLAVLEVPELNAQVKGSVAQFARSKDEITRARNEVARAKSEHQAIHSNYIRLKQAAAAQPGLIAQQELDDAQSKDLAAEAQVDSAKSALSAAESQSDYANANSQRIRDMEAYTRVTAPLNGVITWRYADTGALIQAGTASNVQSLPIVKLSQSDLLRLRLPVPEDAVRYIKEGDLVQVRVDAVNRTFTGKVARFTRDVSADTRTMETEVDVPNPNLTLTPGMYANATLQLERQDGVLTVPVQAIVRDGDQTRVLVLDGQDRVQFRPVEIGIENATEAEVSSGLKQGDLVITGGQSRYQQGEKVRPEMAQAIEENQ